MANDDLVNFHSLTCGIGLDEAQNMVVLIFTTREGKTVQISLSGSGLAGVRRSIDKLAADRPEVLGWQSLQRH